MDLSLYLSPTDATRWERMERRESDPPASGMCVMPLSSPRQQERRGDKKDMACDLFLLSTSPFIVLQLVCVSVRQDINRLSNDSFSKGPICVFLVGNRFWLVLKKAYAVLSTCLSNPCYDVKKESFDSPTKQIQNQQLGKKERTKTHAKDSGHVQQPSGSPSSEMACLQ